MCGLLLASIDAATAARVHATAQADQTEAWPCGAMAGLPTRADRRTWLAARDMFPDAVYEHCVALGYSAGLTHAATTIGRWWRDYAHPWWQSGHYAAIQTLWTQLGRLRYGRILYNPADGSGWWQGRPRKTLFAQRLHPLGTTQWGQQTTPETLLTPPTGILEASPWPIQLCCCYFGDDPSHPTLGGDIASLLVATVDLVLNAVQDRPDGSWLVLEVDEDFGEVLS